MKRNQYGKATLLGLPVALVLAGCSSATEASRATTVEAVTATAIEVTPGAVVSPPPSVRVLNQNGQPMEAVAVTFSVLAGGGTISGSHTATDPSGVATVGSWTAGPAVGANTLTATVAGLAPIVFTATASDACLERIPMTVGTPVNGTLAAGDCIRAGALADNYSLTTAANQALNITLNSTAFDAFLLVSNENGTVPIAQNNNDPSGGGTTNSRIKLIAAAGVHTVTATSNAPGGSGGYTLNAANTTASAENCELVFVELGVITEQTLSLTDCMLAPPFNDDQFRVYLAAGTTLRVTHRSEVIDAWLELYSPTGQFLAEDDDSGGGVNDTDAQITHTAATTGYYIISASSFFSEEVGPYTLYVERLGAAAAPLAQPLAESRPGKPGGRQPRAAR